jgi:hypothetical protein
MKVNEITRDGFYWCSHSLSWLPPGGIYHVGWNLVHLDIGRDDGISVSFPFEGGYIDFDGSDDEAHVPDYVDFMGPLEPPAGRPTL